MNLGGHNSVHNTILSQNAPHSLLQCLKFYVVFTLSTDESSGLKELNCFSKFFRVGHSDPFLCHLLPLLKTVLPPPCAMWVSFLDPLKGCLPTHQGHHRLLHTSAFTCICLSCPGTQLLKVGAHSSWLVALQFLLKHQI